MLLVGVLGEGSMLGVRCVYVAIRCMGGSVYFGVYVVYAFGLLSTMSCLVLSVSETLHSVFRICLPSDRV